MKRILFIEDEKDIRDLVKEEYESSFDIECAAGTKDAYDLMSEAGFDYIIIDLHLGQGDYGTDVFRFIEEANIKLNSELFILSGYVDLIKFTSDEYKYLLNPKNIYLKPNGTFELFENLKNA